MGRIIGVDLVRANCYQMLSDVIRSNQKSSERIQSESEALQNTSEIRQNASENTSVFD